MALLAILLLVVLSPLLWTGISVYKNYRIAKTIGLPIVLAPVDTFNPIWALLQPTLRPFLQRLPFGLGTFARYSYLGWMWEYGSEMHARLGDAFTIVTPTECQVVVADAQAAGDILNRKKDFTKKLSLFALFDIFGPTINSVEGETWQRHKRITGPAFNERSSALVWAESTKQARDMLDVWRKAGVGGSTVREDTNTLALNVLSGAGFGNPQPFDSRYTKPEDGYELSHLQALRTIMDHIFMTLIMNSVKVPTWMLPKSIALVKQSVVQFGDHLKNLVEAERTSYKQGATGRSDLMSMLVRVSEQAKKENQKESGRGLWLSDEEIYGNLFVFSLAGHETTANALAYAVALLAAKPEWQAWIGVEIEQVLGSLDKDDAAAYEELFPQLKRCLAILHETLRLFPPISGTLRWTANSVQQLQVGSKMYTLPPKTAVFVDNAVAHTDTRAWGDDAAEWRPSRWISDEASSPSGAAGLKNEQFRQPTAIGSSFIPWTYGPRICPGKKFSQVEFVAVLAQLFRNNRAVPVPEIGESRSEAATRFLKLIWDSHTVMTVTMKHPELVKVRWTAK